MVFVVQCSESSVGDCFLMILPIFEGCKMKILVRNLERTVTEAELLELFKQYGTVASCNLILDAATGKSVLHLLKCHMHVKRLKPLKDLIHYVCMALVFASNRRKINLRSQKHK